MNKVAYLLGFEFLNYKIFKLALIILLTMTKKIFNIKTEYIIHFTIRLAKKIIPLYKNFYFIK